jgi:hypothetical protein
LSAALLPGLSSGRQFRRTPNDWDGFVWQLLDCLKITMDHRSASGFDLLTDAQEQI